MHERNIYGICLIEKQDDKIHVLSFYSPENLTSFGEINDVYSDVKYFHCLVLQRKTKMFHSFQVKDNVTLIIVTRLNYPVRVVSDLKIDLENQLHKSPNPAYLKIFQSLFNKYDNLEAVDKISQVANKIENVRTVMHDNITVSLQNLECLEKIEEQSEDLMQQAGIFQKRTKELKYKMWWKNIKMKLMIGFVISSILIIIVLICVFTLKSH